MTCGRWCFPVMNLPKVRFTRPASILMMATMLLAVLDLAFLRGFYVNWVGKPKRGLAVWGNRGGSRVWQLSDALEDIALQNIISLIAILLVFWVARRISRRERGRRLHCHRLDPGRSDIQHLEAAIHGRRVHGPWSSERAVPSSFRLPELMVVGLDCSLTAVVLSL